jgi:hypothetical protein
VASEGRRRRPTEGLDPSRKGRPAKQEADRLPTGWSLAQSWLPISLMTKHMSTNRLPARALLLPPDRLLERASTLKRSARQRLVRPSEKRHFHQAGQTPRPPLAFPPLRSLPSRKGRPTDGGIRQVRPGSPRARARARSGLTATWLCPHARGCPARQRGPSWAASRSCGPRPGLGGHLGLRSLELACLGTTATQQSRGDKEEREGGL